MSSGLGKDEWVILIKAFTLLPLVYWDATRDVKEDIDIEVGVQCFTAVCSGTLLSAFFFWQLI